MRVTFFAALTALLPQIAGSADLPAVCGPLEEIAELTFEELILDPDPTHASAWEGNGSILDSLVELAAYYADRDNAEAAQVGTALMILCSASSGDTDLLKPFIAGYISQ